MKFCKQNRKYINTQLKGNISNVLKIQISDLFKSQKVQCEIFCQKCNSILAFNKCIFCGEQNDDEINHYGKRNFSCQKKNKQAKKNYQSMILCIDLSGSMNCSYPTKYQKINKQYVIRTLGQKNFSTISNIIPQSQVIRNFKGIQVLYNSGQSIKDIGYTFRQELIREKQMNLQKAKSKNGEQNKQQITQYITRKQIIQIGISKYLDQIKKEKPNMLVTVVYFNTNIQICTDNFSDKIIIPGLQYKTLQQMIELGQYYADKISILPIQEVSEKLITNMTNTQAEGQTALTPTLAFSIGLAKKFKHDLHQIIVVTDGLSNIGFGQTEQELCLQQSKQTFRLLAQNYAIPNNCVVNVISFQDCAIGYEVIDQLINKTGGIPYNICFSNEKNQKIVTNQTIDYLKLQMVDGFCDSTKQFCFETKISVLISNPKIKIHCPQQYKKLIKYQQNNSLGLNLGIKSIKDKFSFLFTIDQDDFEDQYVKFSVMVQYKKKNKRYFCLREQLISVKKGEQNQAIKDQSNALAKQIIEKLQVKKIQQEIFEDYQALQEKINKNALISQNIDTALLQKFKLKKKHLNQYQKNTDKLSKDKRSMMSRRIQTYKRRQIQVQSEQQQDNGFL